MPRRKSSAIIRKERLRNLKKAIAVNSHMTSRQKSNAQATVNRQLGYMGRSLTKPSFRPHSPPSRAESDRLMRDGLQEIGAVILGWISEPVQKAMDFFHIARGSVKVVKAIEKEG